MQNPNSAIIIAANNFISRIMVTSLVQKKSEQITKVLVVPNFEIYDTKSKSRFISWAKHSSLGYKIIKVVDIYADAVIARLYKKTIRDLCKQFDVSFVRLRSRKEIATYLAKEETPPAHIISMGPAILDKFTTDFPKLRTINLHGGSLPEYQGLGNYIWMLAHGETTATATLHEMVEKIDSGATIFRSTFEIEKEWSAFNLNVKLALAMAHLSCHYLESDEEKINQSIHDASFRSKTASKYYGVPTREASQLLKSQGRKILTWRDLSLLIRY